MVHSKWMISVRTHHKTKNFILTGKDGETTVEVYRRAKAEADKIKAQLEGKMIATVELISRTTAFKPPADKRPPKNHWWCPYCRRFRIFIWSGKLEVMRCPVCGITDHDFYVKKHNGIFKREYEDWLIHKKSEKE
jgi:rubrerythrin